MKKGFMAQFPHWAIVVAQEAILLVAGWTEFFPGTCFPRSIDAEGKETSHSNEDFLSQRVIFAREREKTVDNFIKNSPLIFSCCCCIFCLTVLIFANEHSTVHRGSNLFDKRFFRSNIGLLLRML